MAEQKTKPTHADVSEFIQSFADTEQKQKDSFELLKLMQDTTGLPPYMWGPSIIGFGNYHYKYASGHEGDAPLVGFSPRKAAISLYVYVGYMGCPNQEDLLHNLGKFKMGKSCIYIKKLADIDQEVLQKLIKSTVEYLKSNYGE
ncbi:MAG TPA: DUF1801 domain-containing protein [Sphingobacterium sp.]|nr:DUF1801 domain-containing protein [Sphingobacterium sp.]